MPITLTFYKVSERTPQHEEDVIWLQKDGHFDYVGFSPRDVTVCWSWLDQDGSSCGYNGEESMEGSELKYEVDGNYLTEDDLWCPVAEYWAAFGGGA